jgi:hypothetical protein
MGRSSDGWPADALSVPALGGGVPVVLALQDAVAGLRGTPEQAELLGGIKHGARGRCGGAPFLVWSPLSFGDGLGWQQYERSSPFCLADFLIYLNS